jgi:hypothetical protein
VVDPADEAVEVVLRVVGLADAVHGDAVAVLLGVQVTAAARDHVDVHAVGHEVLRQLAHVPRQAALDDRRVLPAQDQDARGHAERQAIVPRADGLSVGAHEGG